MSVCVHDKVCREYANRGNKILCASCPSGCPYFDELKENSVTMTARQIGDAVLDAFMDADRYHVHRYRGGLCG